MAAIAGVSVAYYTRLEQGHDRSPSPGVLEALADALRLDDDARTHVHVLASTTQVPAAGRHRRRERASADLADLLERHVDVPAMVLGRALDVLVANPLAQVLHPSYVAGRNLVLDVFLCEQAIARYADPEQVRRSRVGSLRMAAGAAPEQARLAEVVGELSIRSLSFRSLWARHEVYGRSTGVKAFLHPDVGRLELRYQFFGVSGADGQELLVYHPESGTSHAQSLALLGTLAAGTRPSTAPPPTPFIAPAIPAPLP